jgi:hypothetical protein
MLRLFKKWWCLLFLAGSVQFAGAFALLGPFESWQIGVMGYGPPAYPGDLGGPHNLGEEFRWNVPVLFYGYDTSFLDYFGSNGVVAVDQAFAVFNNLTNVSSYSPGLTEFPLEVTRVNYRAQALNMYDLKTYTMFFIMEEMCAAQPERFAWTLHFRAPPPNTQCPVFDYVVVKRNFDPVTFEPTPYVNGTLYSYEIVVSCPPAPEFSDAAEFSVDPLAYTFTAVASDNFGFGNFFTGLTRDDVAALRYMWRTNNMNNEASPPGSAQISGFVGSVDTSQQVLITTLNLAELAQAGRTNNAAQLQALYPGLVITSTTTSYEVVVSSSTVTYFQNSPWAPAGYPPELKTKVVYTTNVAAIYVHTYGNVVTNSFFTNGPVTTITSNLTQCTGTALPGTLCPDGSKHTTTEPFINGDYFLLPTNTCGYQIITNLLTTVVPVTNSLATVNDSTNANAIGQSSYTATITYFTNHYFVANPVICSGGGTNNSVLRQGMERMRFVRRDYDSLLGQYYQSFTTNFSLYAVAGGQRTQQGFQRTVSAPDILLLAEDMGSAPTTWPIRIPSGRRTIAFGSSSGGALAGPGIMSLPLTITYNKIGPFILNQGPSFVTEASGQKGFIYGSFDGTTNTPIAYPNGRSIQSLEAQVLMQISTASLPDGTNGLAYNGGSFQLTGSGGSPPYTWTIAPGSPVLPASLSLSSSGVISGTNTVSGTFDFAVRMTDIGARAVERQFTITVQP